MLRYRTPSFILMKLEQANLSVVEIAKQCYERFHISSAKCPGCGAKGRLKFLKRAYAHNLVDYINGKLQETSVEIRQVYCSSCCSAHSVLPDIFIPHKSYCIIFIIKFLKAYTFRHNETVEAICKRFGISTSTYSAWKARYISHMQLYLDKIQEYTAKKDPYLTCPDDDRTLPAFLSKFLDRYDFSFMQYKNLETTKSGGAPESAAFTGA